MSKTATKSRPRLGRGLSSLISMSDVPVQIELPAPGYADLAASALSADGASHAGDDGSRIAHISLELVVPNPHQPRQAFNDQTLAELAESIKSTGLIQPVVVRRLGPDYQLISGERRFRAAKLAGLKAIPAIVREVDAVTQAQMALIENIQREDLNPLERASGYRMLIDQLGLTQAELAGRLGEDRSTIANFLRLLDLAEPVKNLLRDGKLSLGHAKLIAGVSDILDQERLANLVMLQGLSVRNLERVIQQGPAKPSEKPELDGPTAHLRDLEKSLSRQLGLRVQVKSSAKKGKGRLVIYYATLDQFDELLNRLGCRAEE
jgi:ParB family transcriptional regulator, chromosome partitioning protein